jgi:hypothetical protein
MLKKSLVALAISSVAGMASAANIVTEQVLVSQQGAVGNTGGLAIGGEDTPSFEVKLGAEYTAGDIITITLNGAEFHKNTETAATVKNSADETVMQLGLMNQTANTLTYRVTSVAEGEMTSAATLSIANLLVDVDTILESNSVSVVYAAETSTGITLDDAATNTAKLFQVKSQFATAIAPFDAIIDVNEQRLKFVPKAADGEITANTVNSDIISVTAVNLEGVEIPDSDPSDTYVFELAAIEPKQDVVVYGNFAFLDVDGTAGENDGLIETGDGYSIYLDRVVLDNDVFRKQELTITVPGDTVIPAQSFTAKVTATYKTDAGTDGSQVIYDGAAGQWELNGALVHVPFMPFRDGYSPIVNVSNTSTQHGDIEVLVYAENNADWVEPMSHMLPVKAKGQSQTNITSALRSLGIEGDVAFDIIVNAPSDAIEVSALYYSNGDRAVMNTVKAKSAE